MSVVKQEIEMNAIDSKTLNLGMADVLSVYSGRNNACCCGCAGKHTYFSQNVKAASEDRGYKVEQDEVNDRTVLRIMGILKNAAQNNQGKIKDLGNCLSYVDYSRSENGRLYVIYLKKEGK